MYTNTYIFYCKNLKINIHNNLNYLNNYESYYTNIYIYIYIYIYIITILQYANILYTFIYNNYYIKSDYVL